MAFWGQFFVILPTIDFFIFCLLLWFFSNITELVIKWSLSTVDKIIDLLNKNKYDLWPSCLQSCYLSLKTNYFPDELWILNTHTHTCYIHWGRVLNIGEGIIDIDSVYIGINIAWWFSFMNAICVCVYVFGISRVKKNTQLHMLRAVLHYVNTNFICLHCEILTNSNMKAH